jgi:4-diphosphocytidyl-2-C-methyl-D-erythritol kinase
LAPAKINWTLEVLGRGDDGYHEVRSVMQTIELCDEVVVRDGNEKWEMGNGGAIANSGAASLAVEGGHEGTEDDLTLKAVRALGEAVGRELLVSISLVKRIPVAAGLGGGSSDAAAVLRAVSRLYGLGLSRDQLTAVAGRIGSDVPFFVWAGTALVEGRGGRVTPLPDAPSAWLVLLAPPIRMPNKTKRMYEALKTEEFTDGQCTEALAERLRQGKSLRGEDLFNVFERAAYEAFEGLDGYRRALLEAGAASVHLAGAGPTLFSVVGSSREAEAMAAALRGTDARVFVTRTMGASEATGVVVSE